ncbi:hypothetical protein [Profundibacter sp.]
MSKIHSLPAPKARISAKVRKAIEARVRQGASISAAAKHAGMSRNGFAKALLRPPVQEHLRKTQEAYVIEVEASRAVFQARAFEVALELMTTAKSEAVRARMAEFLATGGKAGGSVNVHVDARQMPIAGYEYVRPGQRVVDIVSVENLLGNVEKNRSDSET